MKRQALLLFVSLFLCSCVNRGVVPQKGSVSTPDEAIISLKEGNVRFVAGELLNPNRDRGRVMHTAAHQEPFVAVVGCSDSRVPVELIFDQGIGDIFVIRTAGNTVNQLATMGSLNYAILHLNVKAVVVLGHASCGGVTGAILDHDHSAHECEGEASVAELLGLIRNEIPQFVGKPDKVDEAVRANVQAQVARIKSAPYVARHIDQGSLLVCAAYYDVQSGRVTFFD